jgi:F-type H+-transporting ATPase subunit b
MSALLANPTFWVGVAFFIFFGLLAYYGVPKNVGNQLDKRGQRIADELAEAKRLREDAEKLLKEFEAKRAAAEHEAAEIVSSAREEAERLAREASAEAKIAQAEAQASAEVRAAAVDAAITASERVLRNEITGPTAASLVSQSLSDVRSKLQ